MDKANALGIEIISEEQFKENDQMKENKEKNKKDYITANENNRCRKRLYTSLCI